MKVVVDFMRCESHGQCVDAAPEVFEIDDKNFLNILMPNPPEALRAKVEAAARLCPMNAITIEDV